MSAKFDLSGIARQAEKAATRVRTADTLQARLATYLVRRVPPEAKRDILAQYNIKSTRVGADLGARALNDGVEVTGYARGINLVEFGARETSSGVTATVETGKGARVVPHGFIARAKNGKLLAFVRRVIGGKRSARLPIAGLFGPSVATMLRAEGREQRLSTFAQTGAAIEAARLLETERK
jgi:hypothetical protein